MRKKLILIFGVLLLGAAGWQVYKTWFGPTKIAFVNFQPIAMGSMAKANDNSFIRLSEVGTDGLARLKSYDMVFINGMGLRITEEQRQQLRQIAGKGVPVYTSMATNPANDVCNLDSLQRQRIADYLSNGGNRNYRNLLNYVRREIDGKLTAVPEAEKPVERPADVLYHAGLKNPEEELEFTTVAEYEAFLRQQGLYWEGAQRIAVTGQMADATGLVAALEQEGYQVYPIRSLRKLLLFLQEAEPDAVVNMAHGRLGDRMVEYLQKRNILLFSPLTINGLVEEWEQDPMGMSGGFLSQSVVTPEIDGAIRTYALFAQYEDKEGLRRSFAVPERLDGFVKNLKAYLNLKTKPDAEKRVAIYYYKGPGQNAMTAAGMEVVPSLYRLLKRMQAEGYRVDDLPESAEELGKLIMKQGAVFGTYAEGASAEFMKNGNPEWISREQYESWVKQALRPEKYAEVVAAYGEFPGAYMSREDGHLALARLRFGNIVLMPQPAAGAGDDAFRIVHGTDMAPPHSYIASYLWMQYGFEADALIHFGTHGSLEFTPKKQAALCSNDWPDRLVGAVPHFYLYSIGNVGEGMIAKRRSYAGLQSYLTPPFLESGVRAVYRELTEKIRIYHQCLEEDDRGRMATPQELEKAAREVKRVTLKLGIHRELGLDSVAGLPFTEEEVMRVENFAEELATEKITGQLYTLGVPYEPERIRSSVFAMATEPIAYSLLALDRLRGRADENLLQHKSLFTKYYQNPARQLVERLLEGWEAVTEELICRVAGVKPEELEKAEKIEADRNAPKGMAAMMMAMVNASGEEELAAAGGRRKEGERTVVTKGKERVAGGKMPEAMKRMAAGMDTSAALAMAKAMGASEEALKKMAAKMGVKPAKEDRDGKSAEKPESTMAAKGVKSRPQYTKAEVEFASALSEVQRTLRNVKIYQDALAGSPGTELTSLMNALKGGYTAPSPGGDPIVNPNTLPTGRNMFAVNAEETPTESAWEKGVKLAESTLALYRKRHGGEYPKKVSYTLWSGEFIETGGATIAQVLYMLGVEPVRDAFGRVTDLRLIPSAELGRPRVDVVVQTSGQLRDLAASRLFLINRAVEMAAAAGEEEYENRVAIGVIEAERRLMEKGISPKDAREMSFFRVFGGVNGGYGTGIQGMVEAGDRWEGEAEIAAVYLNNMGAYYGNEKNWEMFRKYAFEAALTCTDVVVQPRQSNTWGALSLDHVYEFMGGMNLAVREVTGKDPDAYLSDYRNRNHNRMQELKEAIGVESRTTIFNPAYIREKMKGGASSAAVFAGTIRNTYGWDVMKPSAVDNELWDEIYEVYVKDRFALGLPEYFERQNPAALQEITAVMLETVRKGLWKASGEQVAELVKKHTGLVGKYGPSCSGFVCDNTKLCDFIASRAEVRTAAAYREHISAVREAVAEKENGVVMKKEEIIRNTESRRNELNSLWVATGVTAVLLALVVWVRQKRKNTMRGWK